MKSISINLLDHNFILYPQKAMYWEKKKTLIISDLHIGKVSHFRKAGIGIPSAAKEQNWKALEQLFLITLAQRVFILGDLFHSVMNIEWEELRRFTNKFKNIDYHLVMGNHDILDLDYYRKNNFTIHPDHYLEAPFIFSHAPLSEVPEELYNICGHIHPAILLKGKARQNVKLPCFYFGSKTGILPAFGIFTGFSAINFTKTDQVYAIAGEELLKIE